MKNTLSIIILFVISHAALAKKYDPPKISAIQAIEKSKTYIVANKIEMSDAAFISEVVYKNIYNEYEPAYWGVKWQLVPGGKCACLVIRVYNDGRIVALYSK